MTQLIRYEQQPGPGLAVRKYVMMRREVLSHDTLRKTGRSVITGCKSRGGLFAVARGAGGCTGEDLVLTTPFGVHGNTAIRRNAFRYSNRIFPPRS